MKRTLVAVLIVGCMTILPCAGSANTITIEPNRDVTIFQNNVNNSSGGGYGLFAGTNGTSSPRRALIGFDIAGSVPPGAVIQAVQLTMVLGQVAGSGSGSGSGSPTIDLLHVTADWGEGTAQSNGAPPDSLGGQGQGAAASGNDATWNARFFPGTLWTTPGGDFSSTASAALQIVGTTTEVPYTWGSTSGMVSDVQGWLDSPNTNFGWMIKNEDEVDATTFRAFYSRNTLSAARHPELQITFSVPEPSGILLAISAMAIVTSARKRLFA
jgi:hypothetical protein